MEDDTKQVTKFKADNYGDVLAVLNDLEAVYFDEKGSYQGNYLAVLRDQAEHWPSDKRCDNLWFFIDSYGSCSGCDWLDAEKDWNTDEVNYQKAKETLGDLKPKFILPTLLVQEMTPETFLRMFEPYIDYNFEMHTEGAIKTLHHIQGKVFEVKKEVQS